MGRASVEVARRQRQIVAEHRFGPSGALAQRASVEASLKNGQRAVRVLSDDFTDQQKIHPNAG